jgi:hypothetical protein
VLTIGMPACIADHDFIQSYWIINDGLSQGLPDNAQESVIPAIATIQVAIVPSGMVRC